MKLKRILALAVSLAMVLSIVPAFGLTASAATQSYTAEVVAHSGSATGGNGLLYVATSSRNNPGNDNGAPTVNNVTTNLTDLTGGGLGSPRIGFVSFKVDELTEGEALKSAVLKLNAAFVHGNIGDSWMKVAAYRTTGAPSAPALGDCDATQYPAVNNDYSYEAAYWSNENISQKDLGAVTINVTKALEEAIAETESGEITISFRIQVPAAAATFDVNPTLEVETGKKTDVTVEYVDESQSQVHTETVGLFVGDSYTPATPGSKFIIFDNVAYEITDVETIDAVAENDTATIKLKKKFGVVGDNLVENGDFETGDLTSWTDDEINSKWFTVQSADNGVGEKALRSSNNNSWNSQETQAIGGERSFQKLVPVESEKVYYYSIDVYTNGNAGLWMNYAFNKSDVGMEYNKTSSLYTATGTQTNCTTTGCAEGTQLSKDYANQWHTFSGLVAGDDYTKTFEFDVYYMHDCPGSMIDNVMLYETDINAYDELVQNVTINYTKDSVVASDTVVLNKSTTAVDVEPYQIVGDGDYYYVSQTETASTIADAAATVTVDNVESLGNVYTWQQNSGSPKIYWENGVDLKHFSAYDWGDGLGNTRIGVATLEVTKSEDKGYALSATQLRDCNYEQGNTISFYVLSEDAYAALDLTNVDSVLGALSSENLAGQLDSKENDNTAETPVTIGLDRAVVEKALGDGSKVVVLGASSHGLYRLKADDMAIVSTGYTVMVDGKSNYVTEGSFKVPAKEGVVAYVDANGKVYKAAEDGSLEIESVTEDITLTSLTLRVSLADGAQVRIGESYSGNIAEDSGLRFIGTVGENSIASLEDATLVVEIAPEDKPGSVVKIEIKNYQTGSKEEGGIFTAVLTNLTTANYNRVFTATPVVTYDGQEYRGNTVKRSIYEIAAGILLTGNADSIEGLGAYSVVADVLNTYVNAVGVRFTWADSQANIDNPEKYYKYGKEDSKPVFFEVSAADNKDGSYTITVNPPADNETIVIDAEKLRETIRINGNHGKVSAENVIEEITQADRGVTFKFTPGNVAQ